MSNCEDVYWSGPDFLKDLINQIPAAIFWKNASSVFLGCNQYFADLASLPSPEHIIGKSDYDLPWGRYEAESYVKDDLKVMSSRIPKLNFEESQTLSNGEKLVLLTNKIPLISPLGHVVGILGVFHDITLRKKMELSIEKAKIKAELANCAKIEFIANMSHDIRTPLSGVVGLSKLLEDCLDNNEQKQYARWINESGEQLLGLLNSILDALRAENSSELDVREDTFDLHQCIADIIQLERPTTELKGIEFRCNLKKDVPQFIISDQTKIHRILLNLIGNAIKFTHFGYVLIEVSVVNQLETHTTLRFSITDTGIGISNELQQRVFERFYRANPSYKGSYSGHGVGLHIAKTYVELLNSKLELKSELGVGSTFAFDLCVKRAPVVEPIVNPGDVISLTSSKKSACKKKESGNRAHAAPNVLVVEDNIIALRMAELLVMQAGGRFISAGSGEDAFELFKTNRFDMIISDIGLPGMSGYELARHIRQFELIENRSPTPIIGLTAHTQEMTKDDCLSAGMNDVFCKPIDLQIMRDILDKHAFCPKTTQISNEKLQGLGLPNFEFELFELESYPLLNIDKGAQHLGGMAMLHEMLKIMLEQELPQYNNDLVDAFNKDDWTGIERIAHKMKGGAVYCGTERLQFACQYLERYHKAGHSQHLDKLYHQLLSLLFDTKEAIIDYLKRVNS